jgi:hypothetical protein
VPERLPRPEENSQYQDGCEEALKHLGNRARHHAVGAIHVFWQNQELESWSKHIENTAGSFIDDVGTLHNSFSFGILTGVVLNIGSG